MPIWLREVTIDLVGENRAYELSLERASLERNKRFIYKEELVQREVYKNIEKNKPQKITEELTAKKELKKCESEKNYNDCLIFSDETEQIMAEYTAQQELEEYEREQRYNDYLNSIDEINEFITEHIAQEELERERIESDFKFMEEYFTAEDENREFKELVAEIKPFGFQESKDVSSYIRNNNLGFKYKNISGTVVMSQDGYRWNFEGGFFYKNLCKIM